jgi:SAM-dependent methyltransferase
MNDAAPITPDYTAIKSKQNAAWASGDYARIGTTLQIVGETLAEAMDIDPRSRVLDVAAGNGNATLAFARRFCDVTSTDYVSDLLAKGRVRADAEGLPVAFQVADAEQLPFENGSFDAVVSTFGVMFTPNQLKAASEMIRVCRSGGKIGMANWTAGGFIGQLFKTLGGHIAPPAGVKSPAMWGDQTWLGETFGPASASLSVEPQMFVFRYRSPAEFVDIFRRYYGPLHKAFLALDERGQAALEADVLSLIGRFNRASDGTMVVPSEYSQVIVTKK